MKLLSAKCPKTVVKALGFRAKSQYEKNLKKIKKRY